MPHLPFAMPVGIAGVESDIASVAEVFALQGDEHMRKREKAYLR